MGANSSRIHNGICSLHENRILTWESPESSSLRDRSKKSKTNACDKGFGKHCRV